MKRSFIREILEAIDDETISFAGGLPSEKLFPVKDLEKASKKVFKDKKHCQYTISGGIKTLRKKIAKFYCEEGFETSFENILITTGSQQALYIISRFFDSKDIVIEKPSYLGAVNIFKTNGLNMSAVKLDNDGIDIKEFKKEFKKSKLAYLIPDFQNPKASRYSNKKRETISKFVEKTGGYLIEDAPYSELYFDKKTESISKYIPNNSFHLGSFSKTLVPGLRIGWVRADKSLIDKLTQIKETIDLHSSSITQHILNEYLENLKSYKKHLNILRKNYFEKMEFFAKSLEKIIPEFEFERPKGGMFIYGKLPNKNTKELVYKALEKKVVYVPGVEFYVDGNISDEIRFNFSHSSKKEIKEGLKRLREIYN